MKQRLIFQMKQQQRAEFKLGRVTPSDWIAAHRRAHSLESKSA
jgi:hypothetical protein